MASLNALRMVGHCVYAGPLSDSDRLPLVHELTGPARLNGLSRSLLERFTWLYRILY